MAFLQWSQKKTVSTKQLDWYDEAIYEVPIVGIPSPQIHHKLGAMHSALIKRFQRPGRTTIAGVTDNGNGTVQVRTLYHIGD